MHSAVYAVVRCLSVRLSVTLVYCIETTELISLGSPHWDVKQERGVAMSHKYADLINSRRRQSRVKRLAASVCL